MSQWFLDIPKYAQELVDGLDEIQFLRMLLQCKEIGWTF